MAFYKDAAAEYYAYRDGGFNFIYYPQQGKVQGGNPASLVRAIEHFAYRGWSIDWKRTNTARNVLYLADMQHLNAEDQIALLSKTTESLYAQSKADKVSAREKLILGNIDNNTGDVLTEKFLSTTIKKMSNSGKALSRAHVVDWFNQFNLETIKLDSPVIILSTKSKATVISEGSTPLWQLFEEGKLRVLTAEAYKSKMDSHGGNS